MTHIFTITVIRYSGYKRINLNWINKSGFKLIHSITRQHFQQPVAMIMVPPPTQNRQKRTVCRVLRIIFAVIQFVNICNWRPKGYIDNWICNSSHWDDCHRMHHGVNSNRRRLFASPVRTWLAESNPLNFAAADLDPVPIEVDSVACFGTFHPPTAIGHCCYHRHPIQLYLLQL